MKQALIVIDMQNGFLNPESPLCIRMARACLLYTSDAADD